MIRKGKTNFSKEINSLKKSIHPKALIKKQIVSDIIKNINFTKDKYP